MMNVISPLNARRTKTDLRPSDTFIVRKPDSKPNKCVNKFVFKYQRVAQFGRNMLHIRHSPDFLFFIWIFFKFWFFVISKQLTTSSSINATFEPISFASNQFKWFGKSSFNWEFTSAAHKNSVTIWTRLCQRFTGWAIIYAG